MGKSLRSQHKKRTRAVKRQQVFKPVEDARLERLAKAQAEAAAKPSVGDFMEDTTKDSTASTELNKNTDTTTGTDAMITDDAEQTTAKKISTSGPRSNRHARKLREKKKKGKKGTNKF